MSRVANTIRIRFNPRLPRPHLQRPVLTKGWDVTSWSCIIWLILIVLPSSTSSKSNRTRFESESLGHLRRGEMAMAHSATDEEIDATRRLLVPYVRVATHSRGAGAPGARFPLLRTRGAVTALSGVQRSGWVVDSSSFTYVSAGFKSRSMTRCGPG